jgi:hypothetical protein
MDLAKHPKFDPAIANNNGQTILGYAAARGDLEVLRALMWSGCDMLRVDTSNKTVCETTPDIYRKATCDLVNNYRATNGTKIHWKYWDALTKVFNKQTGEYKNANEKLEKFVVDYFKQKQANRPTLRAAINYWYPLYVYQNKVPKEDVEKFLNDSRALFKKYQLDLDIVAEAALDIYLMDLDADSMACFLNNYGEEECGVQKKASAYSAASIARPQPEVKKAYVVSANFLPYVEELKVKLAERNAKAAAILQAKAASGN